MQIPGGAFLLDEVRSGQQLAGRIVDGPHQTQHRPAPLEPVVAAPVPQDLAVATDSAGAFVVVWDSNGQDGSIAGSGERGIFGQRYDSAGTAVGSEFQVNTYTNYDQSTSGVAMDPSGGFFVVWKSQLQDGGSFGIFGRRFASTGAPVGSEFQVNTYTEASQLLPALAVDSAGGSVVVWTSGVQDGDDVGVFGQRYDSTGAAVGTEFQVNTYTTGAQVDAAVAADPAGGFVVVWSSLGQEDGGLYAGVFGQRFGSTGAPLGSEFQVNTYTNDTQGRAEVATDPTGGFVVVWESGIPRSGVFGQRYDSTGAAVGGEFQINTYTAAHGTPEVATDPAGNFLVVWPSAGQDGSLHGVFGQHYDSAGTPQGGEFQVNTYTTSYQVLPMAAADPAGGFVMAWGSRGQDGDGFGIFGQRFALAAGTVQAILFDELTDTIEVPGDTTFGTEFTVEARVMFCDSLPSPNPFGIIFDEQLNAMEDNALFVGRLGFGGSAFRGAAPANLFKTDVAISSGVFHHVAYVVDGNDERLYLDGVLIDSRTPSGGLETALGSAMSVGAFKEPAGPQIFRGSFLGLLDTVRVSDTALYSGPSFAEPTGDLTADASTVLLYNFTESSGSTVADESANGFDGTLGVGFTNPDATSPTLGVSACPPSNPIPVKKIIIKPGRIAKFKSTGTFTLPGVADDPTLYGGSLSFSGATGSASYALPASGWTALASGGFRFSGDPCRNVQIKDNMIKAVCRNDTGDLGPLPEPGPVSAVLTVGSTPLRYCLTCGGTPKGNPANIFKRADCPSTCS